MYIKSFNEIVNEQKKKVDEDAPMNATGAAVSTDKPIVRKKKKKKQQYEIWKRAALEQKK